MGERALPPQSQGFVINLIDSPGYIAFCHSIQSVNDIPLQLSRSSPRRCLHLPGEGNRRLLCRIARVGLHPQELRRDVCQEVRNPGRSTGQEAVGRLVLQPRDQEVAEHSLYPIWDSLAQGILPVCLGAHHKIFQACTSSDFVELEKLCTSIDVSFKAEDSTPRS